VGAPYLCPVGDTAALASALQRLIENEDERRSYGAALRQRCEQHYHIDGVAHAYINAYRLLQ
jgi:glycosyltransferase involved in cell wall biosynthesis